jgi:hypothetical protein
MTVLVEDTPRNNLAAWTSEAVADGLVDGAVLSPFSSPWVGNTYKPSAQRIVDQLLDAGAHVWLDPATHALQMPGVGDFRYYDGWDLWGGERGDLTTRASRRDHVLRVLQVQTQLGLGRLAPTVLLHSATGGAADTAFALAEEAINADPTSWVTLAGSPTFWAEAAALDAFVGAMAQLGAEGYFVVVVRPTADLPVAADPDEVAGLCRTARSLEQFGHVHISHGDFAGLPAVSAGASSVGTGWDSRQRVCNYTSYVARDPATSGGGWFKRPTFAGLFGFLVRADAERLVAQDAPLGARLHPGGLHPDAPKEAFLHHAWCLSDITEALRTRDFEPAFRFLADAYERSTADWPLAAQAASVNPMNGAWVAPFWAGLARYGQLEGWT